MFPITEAISKVFGNDLVRFIQIGAADGVRRDPIYPLVHGNMDWSGVFVEPVPVLMQQLKDLHEHHYRFVFDQCAISDDYLDQFFFELSPEVCNTDKPPFWWDLVGSLDIDHFDRLRNGKYRDYVRRSIVPCKTLAQLIDEHGMQDVNLLVTDAEGYDIKILSQIDFDVIQPRCIVYEWEHMSVPEIVEASELLISNGYELTKIDNNVLARKDQK